MRKMKTMVLAATLICGTTMVLTSCCDGEDTPEPTEPETEQNETNETEQDGMNKKITDGNYDKTLAVCNLLVHSVLLSLGFCRNWLVLFVTT